MTPNLKKILYATDLSTNSAYAFSHAVNMALKHEARIVILHVFEPIRMTPPTLTTSYLSMEETEAIIEQKIAEARKRIKDRIKLCRENEFKNSVDVDEMVEAIEVVEGYPAEEIIKMADARPCDVIVMGTHGKGVLMQTFLGSVTKKVLRRIRKPVFIVPLPKEEIDLSLQDI